MTAPVRRNGFALLMTLWLLVPMALSLLVLSGAARSSAEVASNLEIAASLQGAADGGIETALAGLLAEGRAASPIRLAIGAATVTVVVEPLSGLLNPNLASPELLRSLLVLAGAAPARADLLATAIVEWRSPGQSRRAGSTKAAEYRSAGLEYGPPGAPFETVSELLDVLGMTPAIFTALRPTLSLFTDRPPIPELAPPLLRDALRALGGSLAPSVNGGTVFRIVAVATGQGRASVSREAVIQLSPAARPWRVLSWETVSPEIV